MNLLDCTKTFLECNHQALSFNSNAIKGTNLSNRNLDELNYFSLPSGTVGWNILGQHDSCYDVVA